MKTPHLSSSVRALVGGAVCLAILGGMIVGHAWPLWTGRVVLMKAVPVDPRDLFRGEYVRLSTPANRLVITPQRVAAPSGNDPVVQIVGRWWNDAAGTAGQMRGSVVYVQLAPGAGGQYLPVTISRKPLEGALNLRGRITYSSGSMTTVDYGLDAFYMREGTAKAVEQALRVNNVQMEVAIAASGRARIKNLLIDGVPVKSP